MWVKPLVSYNNTSWPALMSCQSPLCRQQTFQLTLWHWFLWHHVTFFHFVGILFTSGIFKLKYIAIRFRIQWRIGSIIKTIIKSDSNLLVGDVDLFLLYCARSFKKTFWTANLETWILFYERIGNCNLCRDSIGCYILLEWGKKFKRNLIFIIGTQPFVYCW